MCDPFDASAMNAECRIVAIEQTDPVRVLAAFDKFKGTASARDLARAVGHACWDLGIDCDEVALADGGEGTLEVLGGATRADVVTGPLGDPVTAEWRLHKGVAVIEMARASGLMLVGGAEHNDAVAASTTGTGELIELALELGAHKIIVCLGGSATTDGGHGAVRAIHAPARLRRIDFVVACDVDTLFTDAARVFAPQKGASPAQVRLLEARLTRLVQLYAESHGVDVSSIPGSGAAGGLAGGLVALGARLVPGFSLVADEVDLHDRMRDCDLVITGEGRLDVTSFEGKVVGGVAEMARELDKPVLAIVGGVHESVDESPASNLLPATKHGPGVVSLVDRFGEDASLREPLRCVEETVREVLRARSD